MDRHYSTLELVRHDETSGAPELVRHDETSRAPERDYDTTAFELDGDALAPQVIKRLSAIIVYTDSELRLYLTQCLKYFLTLQPLRSTRRILIKNVLPASMLPSLRSNGHGWF